MKKLLLLTLFALTIFSVNAQELKYSDVNTIGQSKGYLSYVSEDGTVYKVGDVLRLAEPLGYNSYIFVQSLAMLMRTSTLAISRNTEIAIKEIRIVKHSVWSNNANTKAIRTDTKDKTKFSKVDPFYVEFRCNEEKFSTFTYCIAIDNAIARGEVKGLGLTGDEALTQLKRAKDKLDLDLITKDEYNKIKTELVKYIK